MQKMIRDESYSKILFNSSWEYWYQSNEMDYFIADDYQNPINVFCISRWDDKKAFKEPYYDLELNEDIKDDVYNLMSFDVILYDIYLIKLLTITLVMNI